MPFENPDHSSGSEKSIVKEITADVIIPGNTHKDLWVHPNMVTIAGDPVVIELSLRSTDRRGGDRHTHFNYFRTEVG